MVHNGIIENHESLRAELVALDYQFDSDTDTEVIAHLIDHYCKAGQDLLQATLSTVRRLQGAYAIAVLSRLEPGRAIGARSGSPLVAGLGFGENFIASDIHALLPVTNRFIYLNEPTGTLDDYAVASRLSYFLWNTMPDNALLADAARGRLTDPAVLTASRRAGIDRIYKVGGAQAIAAMAYGTESVPKVQKI